MNNKTDEKKLSIRLYGEQVGFLEQEPTGKMIFSYDESATQPLSMSMPIREKPYTDTVCEAYFGGLLPENNIARKIIGKRYSVSHNNTFSMLKAIGYDCAGAISCHEINDPFIKQEAHRLDGRIISDDELYQHIMELPQRPLFIGVDGLRLSLAGVQDKAAVCLIDGKIALAENGCPTTHILKPSLSHFAGLTENEYFCLKLAKQIGLPVPAVELRKIKDVTFLLIERYDRRIVNNHVERIHQEDFCQAQGILSSKKYQNEGGPGFKECFSLLKSTAQPAVDRNLLAAILVFNYLIGNMDAHGKNFSLLHHTNNTIRLAPSYDLVCTRVYPTLSNKMAMKIGSQYEAERVYARHWEQLCETAGYRYLAMKNLINQQASMLLNITTQENVLQTSMGGDNSIINNILKTISKNAELVIKRLLE